MINVQNFHKNPYVKKIIRDSLFEDIGRADITTSAIISTEVTSQGYFEAENDGILAGVLIAWEIFKFLDNDVVFSGVLTDGARVELGDKPIVVNGKAFALLSAERTALNFIQHLSGIASLTAKYVKAVEGFKTKIVDTRKTTPGLRILEKYAVAVGGGANHRFGLYDGVMIKDNHIAIAGSIKNAVEKVRMRVPHTMKIEVECVNQAQIDEALSAGADILLLDNMTPMQVDAAVRTIKGKALTEASGGITLDNVRNYAEAGADYISIGALTHSASILPFRFECEVSK